MTRYGVTEQMLRDPAHALLPGRAERNPQRSSLLRTGVQRSWIVKSAESLSNQSGELRPRRHGHLSKGGLCPSAHSPSAFHMIQLRTRGRLRPHHPNTHIRRRIASDWLEQCSYIRKQQRHFLRQCRRCCCYRCVACRAGRKRGSGLCRAEPFAPLSPNRKAQRTLG